MRGPWHYLPWALLWLGAVVAWGRHTVRPLSRRYRGRLKERF